jgi:hypothetical protein
MESSEVAPQRVIPAKAGIQFFFARAARLDSGVRRNDEKERGRRKEGEEEGRSAAHALK